MKIISFVGPFNASDLYQRLGEDSRKRLSGSPLYLLRRETGDAVEYGFVVNYPFTRGSFHDFLEYVAPASTFNMTGTVDDWKMPDRSKDHDWKISHSKVERNKRLASLHGSLGEAWTEFERHRPLYLRILTSRVNVPDVIYDSTSGIFEWARIRLQKSFGRKPERFSFRGRGWKAEAIEEGNPVTSTAYRILPETVKVRKYFVKPAIAWQRSSSGLRNWNVDMNDDFYHMARDEFTEKDPDPNFTHPMAINTLAGLLFVAYCAPEIRSSKEHWPHDQGLPGGSYQQQMRAAQVPVLALQKKELFLESGFVKSVEDYLDGKR